MNENEARLRWEGKKVQNSFHVHLTTSIRVRVCPLVHWLVGLSVGLSCICQNHACRLRLLPFFHSITTSFIFSFSYLPTFLFIHSFIHSFMHSFIQSFIQSFIHSGIVIQRGHDLMFKNAPLSKCFRFCQCERKTQKRERKKIWPRILSSIQFLRYATFTDFSLNNMNRLRFILIRHMVRVCRVA